MGSVSDMEQLLAKAKDVAELKAIMLSFIAQQKARDAELRADVTKLMRARTRLDSKTDGLEDGLKEITQRHEVAALRKELAVKVAAEKRWQAWITWLLRALVGAAIVVSIEETARRLLTK